MPRGTLRRILRSAKQDALAGDEVEELILACLGLKDEMMVMTPLYAGLRVGELQHMNQRWINWKEKTINIPARQICSCYECHKFREDIWTPKTPAGIRDVIIQPVLEPILRDFFAYKFAVGVSRQAIEQRVAKIVKRTKITHPVYPHCLRATCATRFAELGMSAPALKYLMGWEGLGAAESYIQSSKKRAHAEAKQLLGIG